MRSFACLLAIVACAAAGSYPAPAAYSAKAPAAYAAPAPAAAYAAPVHHDAYATAHTVAVPVVETYVKAKAPHVPIMKQINQINDDGSYTFGYESGDGSFRVETKDVHGQVIGKYGFIDEFGVLQVTDYVSGAHLGFQPKGMGPTVKVVPSTPEQRAMDYQYSSTDDDQDGMPDYKKSTAYATPAYSAPKAYDDGYGAQKAYHAPAPVHHVQPVVHHVAPVEVVHHVQPVVHHVDPFAVHVQEEVVKVPQQGVRFVDTFAQFGQARQPVTILNPNSRTLSDLAAQSLDANRDGQPDQLVGGFGALPVQQRQPFAIENPTQQQLEDLANQSLDLNKDGIPDELVGGFGPAVAAIPVAPVAVPVAPVMTAPQFMANLGNPTVSDQELFRQLVEVRRMELEEQRKMMEAQRLAEDRRRVEAENRLHAQSMLMPTNTHPVAVAADPFAVAADPFAVAVDPFALVVDDPFALVVDDFGQRQQGVVPAGTFFANI